MCLGLEVEALQLGRFEFMVIAYIVSDYSLHVLSEMLVLIITRNNDI